MDKSSEDYLKEFIATHNINSYDGFYIKDLFKLFMDLNVTDIQSFLSSPDDFCTFCINNISLFKNETKQFSQEKIQRLITSYTKDIKTYISKVRLNKHLSFVNIAKDLSPFKFKTKILDVGPGRIPYSSMLLAKEYDNIKSCDIVYYPSIKTLKNLGIDAMLGYFSKDISLNNIDMVIGQAPCSAFEAIAENCARNNVPYILEACGCKAPDPENQDSHHECFGWEDILPEYDPNVKFYKNYIFNLNTSEEEVKSVINKHLAPYIKFKPRKQSDLKDIFKTQNDNPIKLPSYEL